MNSITPRTLALFSILLVAANPLSLAAAQLRISVVDATNGNLTPARVHLVDASGKAQRAAQLPFWHDHFVCDGTVELELPAGTYRYDIERGPEFRSVRGQVVLDATNPTNVSVRMERLADLAAEGWWSGETHIHRPWQEAELLMRAEDLHVGQFITWWNKANLWTNAAPPDAPARKFDRDRYYHLMGGEDERDGGALLYMDLSRPLDIVAGRQHFPSSVVFGRRAREQGAAWIDLEKPFWWDLPLWIAHGFADSVGIANNHMQRGGVPDSEAWGKRRNHERFPGPQGNGRWTQEIYYHLLNCGVRIPPSAGSASGVLPNPVGYNRVYVHCEDPFTYGKWRAGLLAGRSFVSNGPLLRCRANGELPGHVFKSKNHLPVKFQVELESRDPIAAVELVRNGHVERLDLPGTTTIDAGGWFLIRAIADVTNTFRFASTAPWYVEMDGDPRSVARESAQFFVDWCAERMSTLQQRRLTNEEKEAVLQPWRQAELFWKEKVAQAGRR